MNNIISHLKYLSVDIGPRGSATLNEKKAAEYIKEIIEKNGIQASVEEFSSITSFTWTYLIIYSLAFFSSIMYFYFNKFLGFIISFFALYIFIKEINTKEILSRVIPKKISQNVIGKIKSIDKATKKIVLLAHYDTSRAGIVFSPKRVKSFRITFLLMTASLTFIPLLHSLGLLLPDYAKIFWFISLPFIFFLVFSVFIILHREFFFSHTNGANDNASGVSVLLSLVEYFSKNPLKNTEIYFLFTGAEEAGLFGMFDFLKKYGKELKDAYFINMDNCGKGYVKYAIEEGMLETYSANKELVNFAEEISKENPDLNIGKMSFNIMLTDATAAITRGYKAMSILAVDENNLLPNWHWLTDVLENIDEKTLDTVYKFVIKLVERVSP